MPTDLSHRNTIFLTKRCWPSVFDDPLNVIEVVDAKSVDLEVNFRSFKKIDFVDFI